MEIDTIRKLLRAAPDPNELKNTKSKKVYAIKQRVFLQVLHEILSRRNDKRGEIDEWARCLLELDEADFLHLEDFPQHVLQLAAFQQYRERRFYILDSHDLNLQPLLTFLDDKK